MERNTLEFNAKFAWIFKVKSKTLKKLQGYGDCFRFYPNLLGLHVHSVFSDLRVELVEKFDKHTFEKYAMSLELDKPQNGVRSTPSSAFICPW